MAHGPCTFNKRDLRRAVSALMSAHYTRAANRRRLTAQAIEKLANAGGTSIPAPTLPVRAKAGKGK